jgi:hypothetical protein
MSKVFVWGAMLHPMLSSVMNAVEHVVAAMREEKKGEERKEGEAGVGKWIRPHAQAYFISVMIMNGVEEGD